MKYTEKNRKDKGSDNLRVAMRLIVIAAVFFIAASARAVVLESGIPGVGTGGAQGAPAPSLATYINYLYIFVLGFVGIAGFVSLVIWGTVWIASAVIDKKALALEKIKSTLTGIAIALTAFLMLYTINPDLTLIKVPTIRPITYSTTTTSTATTVPGIMADGKGCYSSSQCYPGSSCNGGSTHTQGVCTRISSDFSTAWEATCAKLDGNKYNCNTNSGCRWCTVPDGTQRCIDTNNTSPYCKSS